MEKEKRILKDQKEGSAMEKVWGIGKRRFENDYEKNMDV